MAENTNIATKTACKMFGVPANGQLTREVCEKYAEYTRDTVKKLNPVEAENLYKLFMELADLFGLDKYAKDGGKTYSVEEMEAAHCMLSQKELADAHQALHSAYFRAIDTDNDGLIQRDEWSYYLKIRNTYVDEEQAKKSFDSIDTNKNGVISLDEFVEYAVDFWCNLGEKLAAKDLYGTESL